MCDPCVDESIEAICKLARSSFNIVLRFVDKDQRTMVVPGDERKCLLIVDLDKANVDCIVPFALM